MDEHEGVWVTTGGESCVTSVRGWGVRVYFSLTLRFFLVSNSKAIYRYFIKYLDIAFTRFRHF